VLRLVGILQLRSGQSKQRQLAHWLHSTRVYKK
jgi:hypothetical protein